MKSLKDANKSTRNEIKILINLESKHEYHNF
jgi:hypothetical protein